MKKTRIKFAITLVGLLVVLAGVGVWGTAHPRGSSGG